MTRFTVGGLAVMALFVLGACTEPGEPTTTTGTPDTTTAGPVPATSAPGTTGPSGTARALPVYYVVDTAVGPRLYREFHSVSTADPASDAVREMLARQTGIDPDYRSHWPAGTELHSPVLHADGVITVDLSGEARSAQVGSELAEQTVQQLVYTVQGALQSTDPVRILVDGAPVAELWGHVATDQPIRRADQYAVRSLVQIDNPAHGAQVGRTFTVSGEAAVFEANVLWDVLRDGAVISSGHTTAEEGQRFSAYRFSLTLEPGEYTVRVTEDDPSGGVGRQPFQDTKVVRVVG
jgi:hypothetical protein